MGDFSRRADNIGTDLEILGQTQHFWDRQENIGTDPLFLGQTGKYWDRPMTKLSQNDQSHMWDS